MPADCGWPAAAASASPGMSAAAPATLAIRPESIRLAPAGAPAAIEGDVELCTYLGAVLEHVIRLDA